MTTLLPTSEPPRTAGAWSSQRPEPARFWVRYRPRTWPAAEVPWSDLGMAALRDSRPAQEGGDAGAAAAGDSALPEGLDPAPTGLATDTVYLPPVPAALERERRELAARLAAAGTPVLLQIPVVTAASDDRAAVPSAGDGVVTIYDPLPLILTAGWRPALDALAALQPAAGSALVWPLVAGLSDGDPAAVAARLAEVELVAVQPLSLDLTPSQRRTLAEGRESSVYDALFHRPPPAERSFARALGADGPAPFLPRPLPAGPVTSAPVAPGVIGNRRIAAALALAAELWLRVGRSPAAGQALYQAARWVDDTDRDLVALAREGNLGVLPALDPRARRIAAEAASESGPETRPETRPERYPSLVRELLAEYLGAAAPAAESVDETVEDE